MATLEGAVAVTPSDTTVVNFSSLWIGTGGNVTVIPADGSRAVTFTSVPANTELPIAVRKVMATGTTATNIVGLGADAVDPFPSVISYALRGDQSIPSGVIFGRADVGWYVQSTGHWSATVAGTDVPRTNYLGTTGSTYKGWFWEPARINRCKDQPSPPASVVIGAGGSLLNKAGNASATLVGNVADATALQAAGIDTLTSTVYELNNNNGGSGAAQAYPNNISGSITNNHSYGVWARMVTGAGASLRNWAQANPSTIPSTVYTQVKREGFLPANATADGPLIYAPLGTVVRFVLFQYEQGDFLSSIIPPVIGGGASRPQPDKMFFVSSGKRVQVDVVGGNAPHSFEDWIVNDPVHGPVWAGDGTGGRHSALVAGGVTDLSIVTVTLTQKDEPALVSSFSTSFATAPQAPETDTANWTRLGTYAATSFNSGSAALDFNFQADPVAYLSPDLGTADHFSQVTRKTSTGKQYFDCAVRVVNPNWFCGLRYRSGQLEVVECMAGNETTLGAYTYTAAAGDVLKLAAKGDTVSAYLNGYAVLEGLALDPSFRGFTRQGFVVKLDSGSPAISNFSAGVV